MIQSYIFRTVRLDFYYRINHGNQLEWAGCFSHHVTEREIWKKLINHLVKATNIGCAEARSASYKPVNIFLMGSVNCFYDYMKNAEKYHISLILALCVAEHRAFPYAFPRGEAVKVLVTRSKKTCFFRHPSVYTLCRSAIALAIAESRKS